MKNMSIKADQITVGLDSKKIIAGFLNHLRANIEDTRRNVIELIDEVYFKQGSPLNEKYTDLTNNEISELNAYRTELNVINEIIDILNKYDKLT